ncbi:MAG: hypothetical protein ABS62_03535 [Microbacterium sp. SCN 70-200]|uniref:DUF3097 family protein n=1 Tax=unclassified Microbacterium TaxID=2609290 RepID=UPI00086BAD09|nr:MULTISPECIES: DUF3097 family protein [unclassified Microbacterium]MBN9213940.1 DUF3097 domain-containing protein [Microbacterium sp.]ODT42477.1 MAG: hypothetical protein ABS62_03535 [Microbacterium sp. SCN 70-200]OJV85394.1 MAG: hypothetical protein BGO46_08730 [Microbacterium sp. 70-16]
MNDGFDRYGGDVLAAGWRDAGRRPVPEVAAERDLVVEVAGDSFCGAVTRVQSGTVELEDRVGKRRVFPLGGGFLIDGGAVQLVAPKAAAAAPARTASGSFAAPQARARVARASRILVEGRHDAELVEKVWGDDLRAEGVVVEYLQGVDLLDDMLRDEPPGPGRRYGVLVDHLVPGSKESRIAEAVLRGPHGPHLRIVGHPHIDVWQCVLPSSLGIAAWPDVPRGIEWKVGVSRALGWPARDQADLARTWQRILGAVHSYRDLDPALLGRVEELIDFVTVD